MSLSSLSRRLLPVVLLAASACARDTAGPRAARYPATLSLVPVFPSATAGALSLGASLDSIAVVVTNAAGDTLGFLGVPFPAGQDSSVLTIAVTLDSTTQTVTAIIELLAGGRVVFEQRVQLVVNSTWGLPTRVDSIPLASAIWTPASPAVEGGLSARAGFGAVYDPATGDAVVFGGSTPTGLSGGTWVLSGGQWRRLPVAGPGPREGAGMVYDAAGGVALLYGGSTAAGFGSDTWEFDGAWHGVSPAASPGPRGFQAMAYDAGRGRVVLFGGHDGTHFRNDTWEFDGTTWGRVVTAAAPSPRAAAAMAYDPAIGKTVLFGGVDSTMHPLGDTWVYDGTTWTPVATAAAPSPRAALGMAYDPVTGRVLLFGGAGDRTVGRHNDLWAFDGTTWTQLAPDNNAAGPSPRAAMGVFFDTRDGALDVAGGLGSDGILSDTWQWNGTTWSATGAAPLAARSRPGMAYDSRDRFAVMYGGTLADSVTWLYDGAWRPALLFSAPGPRLAPAMAYDTGRGRVILFGGAGAAGPEADTWEFDGSAWSLDTTSGSPPARSGAAMAYDARRATVVMFGGQGASGPLADTWEYNGATRTWTAVSPPSAPPARSGAAMAFAPVLGKVVLFGGAGSGGPLADTWTYDGTSWTEVATAHAPPARTEAAMVFERGSGETVLFGGRGATADLNDTWAFDGADWSELYPGVAPSARSGAGMAYDAALGAAVLFGGTVAGVPQADTWLFK